MRLSSCKPRFTGCEGEPGEPRSTHFFSPNKTSRGQSGLSPKALESVLCLTARRQGSFCLPQGFCHINSRHFLTPGLGVWRPQKDRNVGNLYMAKSSICNILETRFYLSAVSTFMLKARYPYSPSLIQLNWWPCPQRKPTRKVPWNSCLMDNHSPNIRSHILTHLWPI